LVSTVVEGHRLEEFQNKFLRMIAGDGTERVTANWRKLHNEELHDL
jgi:hypothetical protein